MVRILIASDETALVRRHSGLLRKVGYQIETVLSLSQARHRLSRQPCDIVIIDICTPDGGAGLLIEQSRAAWPDCAVLAIVETDDLRHTKIYQMGLWTPDATLIRPFLTEDLLGILATLASRHAPSLPGKNALQGSSEKQDC